MSTGTTFLTDISPLVLLTYPPHSIRARFNKSAVIDDLRKSAIQLRDLLAVPTSSRRTMTLRYIPAGHAGGLPCLLGMLGAYHTQPSWGRTVPSLAFWACWGPNIHMVA